MRRGLTEALRSFPQSLHAHARIVSPIRRVVLALTFPLIDH
jgi:hypothetical protein